MRGVRRKGGKGVKVDVMKGGEREAGGVNCFKVDI